MIKTKKVNVIWAILRISMGWTFLWAFIDKVFGLGFATTAENAWINGGSPTYGFLTHATKGPFAGFYQSIAGTIAIDWLFMIGLLLIGLALILGIGVRIAGYSGVLMLVFMYTAGFIFPEHNPFLDDHLIYAVIMIGLTFVKSGHTLGLGKWWAKTKLVRKLPILE